MALKIYLALLLLLPVLLTGVCPRRTKQAYVRAGEMAALLCPHRKHLKRLIWTSHVAPERDLTEDMSRREPDGAGLLVYRRSLVVLSACVSHQGNFSCSLGNGSRRFWFRLTVLPAQSPESDPRTTYSQTCFTREACTLRCPDVNTPAPNMPNMTKIGVAWRKADNASSTPWYISSVEEKDGGLYTCTRSYRYRGETYNMTFAVALDVQPGGNAGRPAILSPHANEVFQVDLGSALVIHCQAVVYSELDDVFWLAGGSFVDTNESRPVYYKSTSDSDGAERKTTASLVFRNVSAADLSKTYTCKLESDSQASTFVTVSLAQKASLALLESLCIGIGVAVIVIVAVLYLKLKRSIVLPRRATRAPDAPSERSGQSRTVTLVPASSDRLLESGPLDTNNLAPEK